MDGRDIGTVVLPNADVKVYLTASTHTRAMRRFLELQEKGQVADLEKIEADIADRDYRDMHRGDFPASSGGGCSFSGFFRDDD